LCMGQWETGQEKKCGTAIVYRAQGPGRRWSVTEEAPPGGLAVARKDTGGRGWLLAAV
jgi:hypothetical protein